MMRRFRSIAPTALGATLLWWPLTGGATGSSEQTCDVSVYPLSTPTLQFDDHADGTVTDKRSKLMWMRCAIGQMWANGTCMGSPTPLSWLAAQAAAQALNKRGSLFFSDWRLPQIPELAGIAERQCKNPRINLSVFPTTPAAAFWSATARAVDGGEAFAYVLSFGVEGVSFASKEEEHDVRLVRNTP